MSASEIYYDPNPDETIILEDQDIIELYKIAPSVEDENIQPDKLSPFLLRVQLNDTKKSDSKLSMNDIAERVRGVFPHQLSIMQSDDNATKLIIRFRLVKSDDEGENPLDALKDFEYYLLHSVPLKGHPEITKVYAKTVSLPRYREDTGAYESTKKEHWVLETDGVALAKVMTEQYVDHRKTVSNDINEIFQTLGIEAVRQALLAELRAVLGFYGIYVNYRHLATLCDVMTQRG